MQIRDFPGQNKEARLRERGERQRPNRVVGGQGVSQDDNMRIVQELQMNENFKDMSAN